MEILWNDWHVFLQNVCVINEKDVEEHCRFKKTREVWQLNAIYSLEMDILALEQNCYKGHYEDS